MLDLSRTIPAFLASTLAVAVLTPGEARAYENQATVGGGLSYAAAVSGGLPANGLGFHGDGSYGLDDVWTLRGNLGYYGHFDDETLHVLLLGSEAVYSLDVVELVPNFGGGLDFYYSAHGAAAGIDLAAHLVLGMDYLISRTLLAGVDFRTYMVPFPADDASLDPIYMTFGARVECILDL